MENTKMTKRQLNALKTKKNIYDAAIKLFNRDGFENVMIIDITNEANVAKGSFYTHFESKESLVFNTYQFCDLYYLDAFEKTSDIEDVKVRLYEFFRLSYDTISLMGKEVMRASYKIQLDEERRAYLFNPDRNLYRCLGIIIEQAKSVNLIDDQREDAEVAKAFMTVMLGAEYHWCLLDTDESLTSMAMRSIENLMEGLSSN